ncbi:unnamed protein product [Moneuplotes crassus]|uniref:Uncharacterized protein n=1 Tax=Euplotes crassus TaxID=5936 RepID=A0AAD1Y5H7_EUPCR|nr:unnamed protein product [Moneuplotes crassus]
MKKFYLLVIFVILNATVLGATRRDGFDQENGPLQSLKGYVSKAFYMDKIGNFEFSPDIGRLFKKIFGFIYAVLYSTAFVLILIRFILYLLGYEDFDLEASSVIQKMMHTSEYFA